MSGDDGRGGGLDIFPSLTSLRAHFTPQPLTHNLGSDIKNNASRAALYPAVFFVASSALSLVAMRRGRKQFISFGTGAGAGVGYGEVDHVVRNYWTKGKQK